MTDKGERCPDCPTTDTMELAREVCGCAWCRGDIPRQPRECHFTHAVAAITEAVGRERERWLLAIGAYADLHVDVDATEIIAHMYWFTGHD